jgi:hypothetical protein
VSRALQAAGGARLLRGTSPHLAAWLTGGGSGDSLEDDEAAFGAAWLRPRAALLLLRGAAAPALAHGASCPAAPRPEPLQSAAAEAMVRLATTVLRAPTPAEPFTLPPAASGSLAPQALLLAPLHAILDPADGFVLLKPFLAAAAAKLRILRPAATASGVTGAGNTGAGNTGVGSAQQQQQRRTAAAAALLATLQAVARTAARRPAAERPRDLEAVWAEVVAAAEETTAGTALARAGREFAGDVSLFFG